MQARVETDWRRIAMVVICIVMLTLVALLGILYWFPVPGEF
jgi:hypothetical protein